MTSFKSEKYGNKHSKHSGYGQPHSAYTANSKVRYPNTYPITYKGTWLNKPIALVLIVICLPVWVINALLALSHRHSLFTYRNKIDALGRKVELRSFQHGVWTGSASLIDIFNKQLSFAGVTVDHSLSIAEQELILHRYHIPTGLVSLHQVHKLIGLQQQTPFELLKTQLKGNTVSYLLLLVKALFCLTFYRHKTLSTPKVARLFGLPINNTSMQNAVEWAVENKPLAGQGGHFSLTPTTQIGYFINAHSVNTSCRNAKFKTCLSNADALFADGSGIRVAAKFAGIRLKANINGTDMLPELCQQAALKGKSIFLLGGNKGVAHRAALNLQKQIDGLEVVGCQHGYFDFSNEDENQNIIDQINQSEANILLVGFGSPQQEFWTEKYADQLNCQTALTVGGLFDFYSGDIPRAPLILRELGLEWLWRLAQEPLGKFKRYVIGTPVFLFRTFILKQV